MLAVSAAQPRQWSHTGVPLLVVLRACGECGAASTVVSYRGSFAGECGAASRVVSDAVSGLWHRGSFAGEGK